MKTRTALFVATLALILTMTAPAANFSAWTNMLPFRFAGYNPPGGATPLTNFPALVVLSTNLPGFRYSDFDNTYADLRFSDSTTVNELNYQVEKWDTNGSSYVWVQVPRLTDSNTQICAFWGKSGQTIPAYTTNGATWSNGYVAVWHMSETNAQDSTSNRYHCTSVANQATPGLADGAQNFTDSSSYMVALTSFSNTTLTIEGWVKHSTLPASPTVQRYLSMGPADTMTIRHAGSGTLDYYFYDTNNVGHQLQVGGALTTVGAWYYVVGTYDGTTMQLFKNGLSIASTAFAVTVKPRTTALFSTTPGENLNGVLDEMRLSSVARSPNWIWACWMNMATNSTFVTNSALLKAPRPVNASGAGVTSDQFDVAQGTKVFAFSTTYTNVPPLMCDPRDGLGLARSTIEPGSTLFADGNVGTTRSITFRTASHLNLTNYQLRVFADAGGITRSINAFALYGSADNITYSLIDSNSVLVPTTNCPGVTSSAIMISGIVNPPPYQFFRLDIKHGDINGPRLVELDGFGTPAAFAGTVRDPIVFNSTLNAASTNTYKDQDPGYATDLASSTLYAGFTDSRQALGASGGPEESSLLFSDAGIVKDNGDLIFGNAGETVHWISWNATQPLFLAGIFPSFSSGDRPINLIRFYVNGVLQVFRNSGTTVCDLKGIAVTTNLFFASPVSGTSFKLELTGGTNSDGVAYGPRLIELDALLYFAPQGTVFSLR